GGVGLEVALAALLVQERVEVADGGVAALAGLNALFDLGVYRRPLDVVVDAGLVAGLAAKQLVDGHAERLALDVPEGDVDGRDRAHDGRTPEVPGAVHNVPVVLDPRWVLPDEVVAELGDGS